MRLCGLLAFLFPLLSACGGATSQDTAGTGGSGNGVCSSGSVTFQVVPAPSSTVLWCMGPPGGCTPNWLTIRDASGDLVLSNSCSTPCGTCSTMACPNLCQAPSPLEATGLTQTWTGTYYSSGTCGASATACLNEQCSPPGQYTAEICGFQDPGPDAGNGCGWVGMGSVKLTCVEKPFELPSSAPIVVTMPLQ